MSSLLLGERLAHLRTALAEEALFPAAYTQASVAHAAGVSAAALGRLETAGTGTAASLAAVLAHYQNQGVNLAWVLVPDNTDVPIHGFRDVFEDEAVPRARQPLATLHRLLQPVMAALDAGQPLPSGALRPLLTQVQEGILHALTHLLPPRRLVLSETDLRAYQRQLPPVHAQSDGWRSAALHAVPRHYYDAGGGLPRCGDPVSYLAYDPGPQAGPDATQCRACRDSVSAPLPAAPVAGSPPDTPVRVAPRARRAALTRPDESERPSLRFLREG
ncbi:hypothetical protein [Hymenobacter arizonensis]|uniref:Uncharacterized protein n=1 Tax=Hymenobacter arizonensis TaxID=1227077 RepID=A0A1I6BMH2_HYMAR|nr:hypothetical protein [Hymenobacter arizonensis]SFQ82138.1 hypothetical protein SAMN04515668_4743 [Hymenobacter arizonensis]